MINYTAEYLTTARPKILKTFSASSGEIFSTEILYENEEDRKSLNYTQIYSHMENLLQYIKDTTQNLYLIDEENPDDNDGWHINGGWAEIEWASDQILKWWSYVYYNEVPGEPERLL
jgi:hypothetical protein